MKWLTNADLVGDFWPDIPQDDFVQNADASTPDAVYIGDMLLEIAREQVLEYAPDEEVFAEKVASLIQGAGYSDATVAAVLALLAITEPTGDVPTRYVYAQLQQAKNLFNAGTVNSAGEVGAEGFTFTPRPLDRNIQRLIRPLSGAIDVL